jgi:DNA-binding MarR family transcriptional regulator
MSPPEQFAQVVQQWAEVFMRRSMADFRQFMADTGLTFVQMNVLMRLYHQGHCGVSQVGEQLGVTNAAASQVVDRLVGMGLVERREDPTDRRAKRLTLTPQGRELMERGIAARRKWIEELAASLPEDKLQQIMEALIMLTEAARASDDRLAHGQGVER